MAVVRASVPLNRPTIIGRPDFYVRYGTKEKEAVASFDFLDELGTPGGSVCCSVEEEVFVVEDEEDEEEEGEACVKRCKVSEV